MKIDNLSFAELKILQAQVAAEIKKRQPQEKREVVRKIRELALSQGFTLDDLLSSSEEGPRFVTSAKPKYRNVDNPEQIWAGRGKKPRWVQAWLDKGGSLEDLLITEE